MATFTLKPYADTLTKDTLYDVSYNSVYFTASGKAKEGYQLYCDQIVSNQGGVIINQYANLVFQDNTDSANPKEIAAFGVKAIGTIRPGDDFLLRFGMASDMGEPGVAGEGQFVAVYDKKMLWRANLYIDERPMDANGHLIDVDGNVINAATPPNKIPIVDWNDRYPWKAADGNAWDENGDGKQSKIEPWTHWGGTNEKIYNTVSYNLASHDNFSQFNTKIKSQYNSLVKKNGNTNFTWPPNSYMDYLSASDWLIDNKTIEQVKEIYKDYNTNEKPYLPGLVSKKNNGPLRRYAAGLECSGFVHRASAWSDADGDDTFYYAYLEYDDTVTQYWNDDSDISVQGVMAIKEPAYTWRMMNVGKDEKNEDYLFSLPLIPGDVVILYNTQGANHIAIVQSITYTDGRGFKSDGVILIESAWGESINKRHSVVMNWQTLKEYFTGLKNWTFSLNRLRVYGNN